MNLFKLLSKQFLLHAKDQPAYVLYWKNRRDVLNIIGNINTMCEQNT
jgi:hypothetical protein